FLGQIDQFCSVTCFASRRPAPNGVEAIYIVEPAQEWSILRLLESVETEIVRTAFQVCDAELAPEHTFEKWYVFVVELLLQILGCCRNDNTLTQCESRNQIGECFAGAGACLTQKATTFAHHIEHGLCHLYLTGPVLITWMISGYQATWSEYFFHIFLNH